MLRWLGFGVLLLLVTPAAQACHLSWPTLATDGPACPEAGCRLPTADAPYVADITVTWTWAPVNDCPENAVTGGIRITPGTAERFPPWLRATFEPGDLVLTASERASGASFVATGSAQAPLNETHTFPLRIKVERVGDPWPDEAAALGAGTLQTFLRFETHVDGAVQRGGTGFAVAQLPFDASFDPAFQPQADADTKAMPPVALPLLALAVGAVAVLRRRA